MGGKAETTADYRLDQLNKLNAFPFKADRDSNRRFNKADHRRPALVRMESPLIKKVNVLEAIIMKRNCNGHTKAS